VALVFAGGEELLLHTFASSVREFDAPWQAVWALLRVHVLSKW
jgi:hypothetical protein